MGRSALALVINILIARWLGPDQFGLFYVFVVTMIVVHNVVGEGLDPAVVRFYAHDAAREHPATATVVGSGLFLRLAVGIPLAAGGVAGGGWLAAHVLDDPVFAEPVRLGVVAALGASLASFGLAILQARHQFVLRALMTPFANLLRALSLPVLLALNWFVLSAVLWIHTVALYAAALIILSLLRADIASARVDFARVRELFHFSKWSALAVLAYLIYSNLAVPVLGHAYGPQAAGIFAAAASLTLAVEQAVAAIMVVQLPSTARLEHLDEFRGTVRKLLIRCGIAALALSPAVLLARPIIVTIYGLEYENSIVVFQILFVGILTNLAVHPASVVFLAMNRSGLFAICHTLPVLVWIAVGLALIPSHAIVGAAWTTLIARIAAAVLIMWLLARVLSPRRERTDRMSQ